MVMSFAANAGMEGYGSPTAGAVVASMTGVAGISEVETSVVTAVGTSAADGMFREDELSELKMMYAPIIRSTTKPLV